MEFPEKKWNFGPFFSGILQFFFFFSEKILFFSYNNEIFRKILKIIYFGYILVYIFMLRIQSIIHANISYSIKYNFEIENSFLIFINIYIIYIYSVKNSKLLVLKWIQLTQNRICINNLKLSFIGRYAK